MITPRKFNLSSNTIYRVDKNYRITAFNAAYEEFAVRNGGTQILDRWGVGSSILDSAPRIVRKQIQQLYDQAFAGQVVELDYECHSPDQFRRFVMRLIPDNETVIAEHSLIVNHPHHHILDLSLDLILKLYIQPNGMILACCNCRKLRSAHDPGRWDLVRAPIQQLPANLTHGICAVCTHHLFPGLVDDSPKKEPPPNSESHP
jgi:hypothetical protein